MTEMVPHDFLVQADVMAGSHFGRFWMTTHRGTDQIALQLLQDGWQSYEAPLPGLFVHWCLLKNPVVLDVGANSGFFSLLAASSGAHHVHAFEPIQEIADCLLTNISLSELRSRISVHRCAISEQEGIADIFLPLENHGLLETSASLNQDFRSQHSGVLTTSVTTIDAFMAAIHINQAPLLIKIDVESLEDAVLRGARNTLGTYRPAIVCEILPAADLGPFYELMQTYTYCHFALHDGQALPSGLIHQSMTSKNHLFLPAEAAHHWPLMPLAS